MYIHVHYMYMLQHMYMECDIHEIYMYTYIGLGKLVGLAGYVINKTRRTRHASKKLIHVHPHAHARAHVPKRRVNVNEVGGWGILQDTHTCNVGGE